MQTMSEAIPIGIMGGSGLYAMPGLSEVEERRVETPYGAPSDALVVGRLEGARVAFLSRHGRGHRLSPSEVPYRANVYAMKVLGVEQIISLSAVGSLKEEHRPLDFVLPDQFIDRTQHRVATFFGDGLVAHVGFAEPTCGRLRAIVAAAGAAAGVAVRTGGTYVNMEGPAFSTRAESNLYRSWGADVIGMTNLTEAKLAREAEICYATVAMVTDYDCWHPGHEAVTVSEIVANLGKNAAQAAAVVGQAVKRLGGGGERGCGCGSALRHALITDPKLVPAATRERLGPLIGKYFS
ncbi:MAG TPA: S-methyl-5'-thioadenosine phosphorylase [Terriglobales bacterium]|nr:S-methyl-5'-thioadenosine phosphorylase [Terriglobales bacterium]